jgi:hypothetical protein
MKAMIKVDHADCLEQLRDNMINNILNFIPNKGDKIEFKSSRSSETETIQNPALFGRVYYGFRYPGYSDRYDCDLESLSTDDLSEILTILEALE